MSFDFIYLTTLAIISGLYGMSEPLVSIALVGAAFSFVFITFRDGE